MHKSVPSHVLVAGPCLPLQPAVAADWSWDPLKDVENVLPPEAPNEARILQGRHQVQEMAGDALTALYEINPGLRRPIERSAGYAVFSTFGLKLLFSGGTSGKGLVVNHRTGRPPT